jgi:hypothetical protein
MAKKPLSEEEQLRRNQKQLGLTWAEIQAEIDANSGTFDRRARVRGARKAVRVILRVKRAQYFMKWAMSVVAEPHGRIDGIDWERKIDDHRGKTHNCSGWHRHMWKPGSMDRHKECLKDFAPKTIKDFIVSGFRVLNVQIKKEGAHANGRLPLD